MNVLELFAGSQSFSNVAKELGMETFTSDCESFDGIDYVTDIFGFSLNEIPFTPNIIWASPPCTTFSVASIGCHWTGGTKSYIPKTKECQRGLDILARTIAIIDALHPKLWYIENPRGVMRKIIAPIFERHSIPFMIYTVTYCQYGDTRMKPTDIWTNNTLWSPRPMCKNGDPCHERAPRGSKTGTQGLKGDYERSKVPYELCKEILDASK